MIDLLSIADAAAQLGISERYMRRLIRQGRVPTVQIHQRFRLIKSAALKKINLPGQGYRSDLAKTSK